MNASVFQKALAAVNGKYIVVPMGFNVNRQHYEKGENPEVLALICSAIREGRTVGELLPRFGECLDEARSGGKHPAIQSLMSIHADNLVRTYVSLDEPDAFPLIERDVIRDYWARRCTVFSPNDERRAEETLGRILGALHGGYLKLVNMGVVDIDLAKSMIIHTARYGNENAGQETPFLPGINRAEIRMIYGQRMSIFASSEKSSAVRSLVECVVGAIHNGQLPAVTMAKEQPVVDRDLARILEVHMLLIQQEELMAA